MEPHDLIVIKTEVTGEDTHRSVAEPPGSSLQVWRRRVPNEIIIARVVKVLRVLPILKLSCPVKGE